MWPLAQAGNGRINLCIVLLVKTGVMCFAIHSHIVIHSS